MSLFIIHALFQTLSSHHGSCCGQAQCHPNWGQPKITAHFIHYVIFASILANFLYIKGLWNSLTVSKCCGSMGVCWNQHHVLLFSLCSDGSRCLIYQFLSDASGNSMLHSSVITHLREQKSRGTVLMKRSCLMKVSRGRCEKNDDSVFVAEPAFDAVEQADCLTCYSTATSWWKSISVLSTS